MADDECAVAHQSEHVPLESDERRDFISGADAVECDGVGCRQVSFDTDATHVTFTTVADEAGADGVPCGGTEKP